MAGNTSRTATARLGKWLPSDPDALQAGLDDLARQAEAKEGTTPFHPVIREFQGLIERDPVARLYLSEMIAQIPPGDREGANHLTSVDRLLTLINEVLTRAPDYNATGLVGTPLNAILDQAMGTPAGLAAFRNSAINAMFRKILTAWCDFLSSPASLYVLNDTPRGWMCPAARDAIKIREYRHDPHDAHWGFASWNDFFTRRFTEGAPHRRAGQR